MTAREKIFSALSAALDPLPERARRPEVPHGVADAKWMASCPDVISLFSERLQEAGTACFESPEDLAAWMASRRPKQIFVPPEYDDLAATLSVAGGVTREYRRDRVNEIDATLTVAAGGIAERCVGAMDSCCACSAGNGVSLHCRRLGRAARRSQYHLGHRPLENRRCRRHPHPGRPRPRRAGLSDLLTFRRRDLGISQGDWRRVGAKIKRRFFQIF